MERREEEAGAEMIKQNFPGWLSPRLSPRNRIEETFQNMPALLRPRVFPPSPQVSWIRTRDVHIMTMGRITYSTDPRVSSIHPNGTGDWNLQLRNAKPKDSGTYECQINTEPKKSKEYRLNVVGE